MSILIQFNYFLCRETSYLIYLLNSVNVSVLMTETAFFEFCRFMFKSCINIKSEKIFTFSYFVNDINKYSKYFFV